MKDPLARQRQTERQIERHVRRGAACPERLKAGKEDRDPLSRRRGTIMNLTTSRDTPPWEWPEGTAATLLGILQDDRASTSDLLLPAELAGDVAVINS
jgi:hypothetical protein